MFEKKKSQQRSLRIIDSGEEALENHDFLGDKGRVVQEKRNENSRKMVLRVHKR